MSAVLHTARLTLRRAEPGDVDDLHAVFTQAPAMRYWGLLPDGAKSYAKG